MKASDNRNSLARLSVLVSAFIVMAPLQASAQNEKRVCPESGVVRATHTAYLILDQSDKSEEFKRLLGRVSRPDLLVVNFLKGDFTYGGPLAERYPLVYVFDKANPTQVEDPIIFVAMVNRLSECRGK